MSTPAQTRRPAAESTSAATRRAVVTMYAGLALTVLAMLAVFIDQVAVHGLSHHLRDVYADYKPDQAGASESVLVTYLYTVGGLGIVCWLWVIRATKSDKGGTRATATVIFVLGSGIELVNLFAQEYGNTILPTPLGLLGVLPCLAGLFAVVVLWRRDHAA